MASGFYSVPRVPLPPKEKQEAKGKQDEHEGVGESERQALLSEQKASARDKRQHSAALRRVSTTANIRYSTALPGIPEYDEHSATSPTDDNARPHRCRQHSECRYEIVMRGGKIHLVEEKQPQWFERQRMPARVVKLLVLLVAALSLTGALVSAYLYCEAMAAAHSDTYVAMAAAFFWITIVSWCVLLLQHALALRPPPLLLAGLPWKGLLVGTSLLALGLLLIFLTSLPWRASPRVQMVLLALHIPATALASYTVLGIGVSCRQVCCLLVLLAGVFVTLEPTVLLASGEETATADADGPVVTPTATPDESTWQHGLLYAAAWLPLSFWTVWTKRLQAKYADTFHVWSYLTWNMTGVLVLTVALFWANLIPQLGQADSPAAFWSHVRLGVLAFYGASDTDAAPGPSVALPAALTILLLPAALLLYVRVLDFHPRGVGAHSVALITAVSCLGTVFWTLVSPWPSLGLLLGLTQRGVFTLVGVVITALAAFGYAHFQDDDGSDHSSCQHEQDVGFKRHERPLPSSTSRYQSFGSTLPSTLPTVVPGLGQVSSSSSTRRPSLQPISHKPSVPVRVLDQPRKSGTGEGGLKKVKSAPVLLSI